MSGIFPARARAALKGGGASLILLTNVLVVFTSMLPVALLKLLVPLRAVRRVCDCVLNTLAGLWVSVNNGWMRLVQRQPWDVRVRGSLKRRGWYLVSANHQSWVDILVLQRVFNGLRGRIPLLKFFIKRELIYVPFMGLAWWALDFPFMRRSGGAADVARDLAVARKSCEKFRLIPTSVISFVEGTRFTLPKRQHQKSPYRHLLRPKLGGLSMALATMGDRFDALLDVTIVYPGGAPSFWDLLSGKVRDVIVRVQEVKIPLELRRGEDAGDPAFRARLQTWIGELWAEKDRHIAELLVRGPAATSASAPH